MQKSSKPPEDDSELRTERNLKSVSFVDSVSVISGGKENMEVAAHSDESQKCHSSAGQNGTAHQGETMESEVAQEIRYLDEVLEANCCEPAADMTSNGTSSPEPRPINIDGNGPSVEVTDVSLPTNHGVVVERNKQTTFVGEESGSTRPNGHSVSPAQDDSILGKQPMTTIKKEARFELRSFQEEKKPSKLFDAPVEKEIRVKKVRPSEEIAELEKERLELIRGQAVKKNPGIAAKWWNPPQERTLEEELDADKLESHRKYEERKQKRMEYSRGSQSSPNPTTPSPTPSYTPPEPVNKDDIVTEQVDFSAARKQFLQMEHVKQPAPGPRRGVAPQLYSAKPFSRVSEVTHVERPGGSVTVVGQGLHGLDDRCDVTTVKTERIFCSPGSSPSQSMVDMERKESPRAWNEENDITCAHAVMTLVKDDEPEMFQVQRSSNSSYHPEEIDSGLDDLSVRSQDTTVLETLSNDFSMDNVSDSGASNETMSAFLENSLGDYSFPSTPMATTPINGKSDKGIKSPDDHSMSVSYPSDSLTEEELEYHAGVLVQNAIQQAIAQQNDEWEPREATQQSSPIPERRVEVVQPSPPAPQPQETPVCPVATPTPSPRVPTPGEEKRPSPIITIQAAASRPCVGPRISSVPSSPTPTHACAPAPVNTYKPPSPSPPPAEKPEFSYFSKYSEAAELRSTASVMKNQDAEVTAGPFKLRSRKQRTLSMIEEEIRAAQEREEELKKQRQTQTFRPQPAQSHKQKTNSLPAKLVLPGKTAPGKE